MKSFEYTITDPVGIHARPAGILAKEAKGYDSVVKIINAAGKAGSYGPWHQAGRYHHRHC